MMLKILFVILIIFLDGSVSKAIESAANDNEVAGRFKRGTKTATGTGTTTATAGGLIELGIKRIVNTYATVLRNLGTGQSGSVDLVRLPSKVAVKKIHKEVLVNNPLARNFLKNEIDAYQACDSPFVVKMYDVFEDKKDVNIVLEPVENSMSLIKLLEPEKGQPANGIAEDYVRFYIAQAFLALNHLHSKGYTHNDAWIENFLLDKQGFVKLIDFGLAFKLEDFKDPSKNPKDPKNKEKGIENSMPFRGWYYNRAPERIELKEYGPSSDFWALGLLTYRLAFAKEAFNRISKEDYERRFLKKKEKKETETKETEEQKIARWKQEETMILTADYEWPESPKVSDNMRNFIESLLVVDPKKRLGHANPDEIKNHVWFTSVNFKWDALEKRDASQFRDYLAFTSQHVKDFLKTISKKVSDSKNIAPKVSDSGRIAGAEEDAQEDAMKNELLKNFVKKIAQTVSGSRTAGAPHMDRDGSKRHSFWCL